MKVQTHPNAVILVPESPLDEELLRRMASHELHANPSDAEARLFPSEYKQCRTWELSIGIGKHKQSRCAVFHGYGHCPQCFAPGTRRERRLNGNDTCERGHEYPSSTARNCGCPPIGGRA